MEQSSSTPRELTLDEAMACAVECLKNGQMDEAEVICRKILEVAPDHPDALHYSGMLAYKRGRREDAMALMARSLELAPAEPDWHSNLGIILQAQGDLDGAIACFERAIALRPSMRTRTTTWECCCGSLAGLWRPKPSIARRLR